VLREATDPVILPALSGCGLGPLCAVGGFVRGSNPPIRGGDVARSNTLATAQGGEQQRESLFS